MAESPIIRNLESLRQDMVGELRQALWALHPDNERPPELSLVERKIRNVLEYLTGNRE